MSKRKALLRLIWKDISSAPFSLIRGVGSTVSDIITGPSSSRSDKYWRENPEDARIFQEEISGRTNSWEEERARIEHQRAMQVQRLSNQVHHEIDDLRDETEQQEQERQLDRRLAVEREITRLRGYEQGVNVLRDKEERER